MLFCFFFVISCCNSNCLFAQQDWFTGLWKHYSIVPDNVKGQQVKSDLQITGVKGNSYTGIQKIYCSSDTNWQAITECSGSFTNGDILFTPGKEMYRKEPQQTYLWNAYVPYVVAKSYFSVSHQKLILHIEAKKGENEGVKAFMYYRDLLSFDSLFRLQIEKRYGFPRLIDDTEKVIRNIEPDVIDTSLYVNAQHRNDSLPTEIVSRKNTLVKTITLTSPDIQVVLLDDAEIDGDIISLYHNNQLVIDHKTLGKEMIKYTLKADKQHAHHEFILVAENLGSIPPNTALMRIRAGDRKYEFVVHSDMHENVKVIIDYTGE